MRRCHLPTLAPEGSEVALPPGASHHIVRVCRLGPGDELTLFDGRGHQQRATLRRVEGTTAWVRADEAPREAPVRPQIHLVLGLPKGPAVDDAVRMAVEAGATHLHPVHAARTQGRPERSDRWERIASSAAAQCGRADLPVLEAPASLDQVLARLAGVDLWIAQPACGAAPSPEPGRPAAILIGPEGGWTEAEVDRALAAGARGVELGPWVLRTPTAAAVGVAWLARAPP